MINNDFLICFYCTLPLIYVSIIFQKLNYQKFFNYQSFILDLYFNCYSIKNIFIQVFIGSAIMKINVEQAINSENIF